MAKTWILVANGSVAKLFEVEEHGHKVLLKQGFSHPNTTKKDVDIHSDRPGRSFSRTTRLRHAIDPSEDPKDHERHQFAVELGDYLAEALEDDQFASLIIVSSREMLGELRGALSPNVLKTVAHELAKDLLTQNLKDWEIAERIRNDLDLIHL
ncbi:MAG TPA: host attachment protein [Myxococcota bacterium]|nr:host attachment protein [Myxococcota bacterium]